MIHTTTDRLLRDRFFALADGDSINDPHGNVRAYLGKVLDPSAELDRLAECSEAYLRTVLPSEQYRALQSPEISDTDRIRLVTRAVMRMPFDYLGNAQKTLGFMLQEEPIVQLGDTLGETSFHYLRTPVETLDGFLRYGTGGDCFSTSFTAQILYSACELPARLALASDKPLEQSNPKDMHHCAVIVSPNGRNYYVDTSLNVEVPVTLPSPGEVSDSDNQSSIFS